MLCKDGNLLYMAVPRMASLQPFFLLDPDDLGLPVEEAAEKKGRSAGCPPGSC